MKRKPYNRYFDKGLRGWIVKTAHKHYWRVAAWHDMEDLIQEGNLAFAICRARYSDKVQNKAHFMALVKIIFLNRITDMANQRTLQAEIPISQIIMQDGREVDALEYLGGSEDGGAELAAVLLRAPVEVQALLLLLRDPELCEYARSGSSHLPDGKRETTNQRFCRLLGLPKELDLEGQLRTLLWAA